MGVMGWLALPVATMTVVVPAVGQEQASRTPEIQVSATATVMRPPDHAVLMIGASHLANRAADAASQNAATVQEIMRAVGRLGFPRDSLVTASYTVHPEYRRDREGQQLIGYRVETRVRLRVHDLARLGPVIDAALDAGATEVAPPQFGTTDQDGARRAALERAVVQARRDAEAIARAAGGALGPLLQVVAGDHGMPGPQFMAMAEARAAPPIVPGDVGITAAITARFAYLRSP